MATPVALDARVLHSFEAQAFMAHLGAELASAGAGRCEIVLPVRPELCQQHGRVHGGVVATLVDNAGGFAAFSLMADDEQPLSVECKLNFLSAAQGDRLVARGEVRKNGRRLKVSASEVYAVHDDEETLCALGIVTVMALRMPSPAES